MRAPLLGCLMRRRQRRRRRFVVVLGKLTMDVSRGFGGKFTRMCFGSGGISSSSTSKQARLELRNCKGIYIFFMAKFCVYVSGARSSKGRHMSLVMTI